MAVFYIRRSTEMNDYKPAGTVHHAEDIRPGPGGTILHTYWDKCQARYVREMYTREEWEKMMKEETR
jgi:hypothetical protein